MNQRQNRFASLLGKKVSGQGKILPWAKSVEFLRKRRKKENQSHGDHSARLPWAGLIGSGE